MIGRADYFVLPPKVSKPEPQSDGSADLFPGICDFLECGFHFTFL